jgi:TolA-binding protein
MKDFVWNNKFATRLAYLGTFAYLNSVAWCSFIRSLFLPWQNRGTFCYTVFKFDTSKMTRQTMQKRHIKRLGLKFPSELISKIKRLGMVKSGICALLLLLLLGVSSPVEAKRYRLVRKAEKHSVIYRAGDAKSFYRALSFVLDQQPPDDVSTINAKSTVAQLLFDTGNYREAAQIFLQLTEAPLADTYKLYSFQYRLAECYFYMGLYSESYDQFSRVRSEGHSSLKAEATLGMAMAALAQGNRSSAQAHLDILLLENDYYRTYARALYPSGIMLFQNEQYGRSLEFFEKDLDDPKNVYFAGLAYRRQGMLPKALQYFQKLTQKFPGTVWAQRGAFEVAETYYQQQDFPLAYQSFQRWLNEYPNGTLQYEAQFRMACTDFRRKQYPDVISRLDPLLKQDLRPSMAERVRHMVNESFVQMDKIPELVASIKKKGGRAKDRTPDENYQLMWSLAALNRYEEALALAEEGLGNYFDPELTPKILLVQGFCYDKIDKIAEALAAYQTVVDRFPKSAYAARALHLMAMGYVKIQRWQELVTHVYHHWAGLPADLKQKYPEVEFWITEGQLTLGNFDIAQKRYQQYISAAPDTSLTPFAYLGMAVAQAQNNQLELGFQTLQQFAAIAKQKNRPDWLALATMQSGNLYYNQKKYEQAIGYYKSFQKDYPQDPKIPQAMYQEAQSLYRLEYYTDAIDAWVKLADKYPDFAQTEKARFQAARTLFDLGETTSAVKAFQTFIVKHPNSDRIKDARLQLAHSYYNAGNYKEAIPLYQQFLLLYPKSDEAVSVQDFLQMSYVQAGKSEQEIEQLTQGQAKSAVLADLYWTKGAKAYNDKDYKVALTYFEKVMIDFPASSLAPQAGYYRAESLYLQEKYEEASAAYKNFLAQFPNDTQAPTSLFRLGVCLFNLNRFEESASTFESLIQKYPDDPLSANAAENIPLAYAKVGKIGESEKAYETLLTKTTDPKKRAALILQIAQIKEKNGVAAEAIQYYEQISPSEEEYAEALYAVGNIYARASQTEQEVKTYEKLNNFNPKDNAYRIAALSRLAELYISQGQAQKAMAVYKDVEANAKDETALANAKSRLEELQKVLEN